MEKQEEVRFTNRASSLFAERNSAWSFLDNSQAEPVEEDEDEIEM